MPTPAPAAAAAAPAGAAADTDFWLSLRYSTRPLLTAVNPLLTAVNPLLWRLWEGWLAMRLWLRDS
jgi:hypothetical protein